MSAVVLPAASEAFTSTQVIFSNSTRSVCERGAARADPAASIREAVPPAINISKECETEPMRMSFSVSPVVIYLYSANTRINPYANHGRHKRGRRHVDFATCDVGRGATHADRGHNAVALTRLRFDLASAPPRDTLLERKKIGRPAKIGLRCHGADAGGTGAARRGIFFD